MNRYIEYWWKLWQKSWTFNLPQTGAWGFPSILGISGLKLSFGVWARLSKDSVMVGSGGEDAKEYNYEKLGASCIRVFALEPGAFDDPLKGTLVEWDLQNLGDREYEALSYVWGRYYPGCFVDIDNTRVKIFGSLDDALRHLRWKHKTRYIWADSICINQFDLEEKSSQVLLMAEVYQKASTVNIWLGLSNEDSAIGIEILSFLASGVNFQVGQPWTQHSPELSLAGLNDVLQRPYFQRIWVVQEVVVAKQLRMIVGRQSFEWFSAATNRFLTRLKFAEISPSWEQTGLAAVNMTALIEIVELCNIKACAFQPKIGSLDIIHNMRRRKATDRRDMVFALIGLAQEEPQFQVDYTLTTEELYQRLLKHFEEKFSAHLRTSDPHVDVQEPDPMVVWQRRSGKGIYGRQ